MLRPWEVDTDGESARRAFDDPDIQFWHTRRLDSAAEAGEWLASWAQRWSEEADASWAIVNAAGGAVVGQVGLRTVSLHGAQAQMSYWVLPEARGRRLALHAAGWHDLHVHARVVVE